jgi:hypothetical protein
VHLHRALGGDEEWCRPAGYFDKNKPFDCHCVKRWHGQPRQHGGMCHMGIEHGRNRVYRWRAQVPALNRALARGYEPDEDIVAVLSSPWSVYRVGMWQA